VRGADNVTGICELTVYIMWDPQHPSNLQTSTACYGDSFALLMTVTSGHGIILMQFSNVGISLFQPQCLGSNRCGHYRGPLTST
jgi:hypothetical protein